MYCITKVKIVSGTTVKRCSCFSWLEHWGNFSNEKGILCSAKLYLERQLVGVHVKKMHSTNSAEDIIPICPYHNKLERVFEISDDISLVSANPKDDM